METYIVRFYRRARSTSEDAVGTVEHVGSGRRAGFTGERELLDRLLDADGVAAEPLGSADGADSPQPGR